MTIKKSKTKKYNKIKDHTKLPDVILVYK